MVRTQIYLTEKERKELEAIAKSTNRKQSEVIREAVDQYIDHSHISRRRNVLKEAAGIWKDRCDIPDYESTRRSWDRD
jgi:predicted transcriptional regulator